jgi:hypothetical protein
VTTANSNINRRTNARAVPPMRSISVDGECGALVYKSRPRGNCNNNRNHDHEDDDLEQVAGLI